MRSVSGKAVSNKIVTVDMQMLRQIEVYLSCALSDTRRCSWSADACESVRDICQETCADFGVPDIYADAQISDTPKSEHSRYLKMTSGI